MAALVPNPVLSKSKFLNWIKAALAVLLTKEEVEPVVYDVILQFQQKCLQDIATSNNFSTVSTCSNCNTENVVICPFDRVCNSRRGKCSYHKNRAMQYLSSGCPNNVCHHMKSMIDNAHRFHGPSYKNTDATQWSNNPWEIAKCYMPPDGYKDVTNVGETDFNGIVSVIINHKEFDSKINDDLSKKNNIFDQGREVGKDVRHSPNLEVEDADLVKYFTIMDNILSDPGFIAINKTPHNARQKLAQLQNDELVVGKDVVRKVLAETKNDIQEQIRKEMIAYRKETEERRLALIDIINAKVTEIEKQADISLTQLNDLLKSSVDDLEVKLQEIKDEVDKGKRALAEGLQEINSETEGALKAIQKEKELQSNQEGNKATSIWAWIFHGIRYLWEKKIQSNQEGNKATSIWAWIFHGIRYHWEKKKLRNDLIKFYQAERSTIPLSPLVEEKDTPLAGFYVMPDMDVIRQKSPQNDQEERTRVNSLEDLFTTGSTDKQIYVSADAGFGKTAFSKYLSILWCNAFSPVKDCKKMFNGKDVKALSQFEFLFLILLRDINDVCRIDEMIEQQLMENLPPSASLQDILRKENCLIILDGLDEWTHPVNNCTQQRKSIPHRFARDNCVILTTTRPWKLGVSNLKTSEINKKVELVELSKKSMHQLEENAISKMSDAKDDDELKKNSEELDEVIASRGLHHMQAIPLLLMYITCLWCNNIPIGDSKFDVYIKVVEFLLSRTAQKHSEVRPSSQHFDSDIPDYLKTHKFCQKFYSVLTALAELAYRTSFSDKRENTLVFDGSVAEKYLKADDMKICLLSGILTESTTTTLIGRKSKVSFSHKTVQEFFAAMFISSQSNTQETVLEKCKNVQSILDMSMICEFLSKMNSNMMCEISTSFMSVINEDEKTRDYRNRKDVYEFLYDISSEPLYNIQKMLLSCLKEMPESENIKLCLQDFFIHKDTIHGKNLQRLSKLNQTNMKSLYIDMWLTSSSFREILELFSLTDLNNLQKLNYRGDEEEADISVLLSPCLQIVELSYAKLTKYEEKICEKLVTLKHVKYLYIREFTLSHKILEKIFNFISGNKTIKDLTLGRLSCKDHGRDCLMKLDLSEHSQLKELELLWLPSLQLNLTTSSLVHVRLWDINLDESSLLLSRDMLNIERVELMSTKISAVSFREFIKVLENLPQTVTVVMLECDIKPETEGERVRKYIRRSQTFVVTENDSWPERFVFHTRKPSKE